MKRRVISYRCLPTRIPVWPTLVTLLILDRFQPRAWVWALVGFAWALIWFVAVRESVNEVHTMIDIDEIEEPR
jgi:hypothetical protein